MDSDKVEAVIEAAEALWVEMRTLLATRVFLPTLNHLLRLLAAPSRVDEGVEAVIVSKVLRGFAAAFLNIREDLEIREFVKAEIDAIRAIKMKIKSCIIIAVEYVRLFTL